MPFGVPAPRAESTAPAPARRPRDPAADLADCLLAHLQQRHRTVSWLIRPPPCASTASAITRSPRPRAASREPHRGRLRRVRHDAVEHDPVAPGRVPALEQARRPPLRPRHGASFAVLARSRRIMIEEVPSNRWEVNRAALRWLRAAGVVADPLRSYLAQLADHGLEAEGLEISRPLDPSHPDHEAMEMAVGRLVGMVGDKPAAQTSRAFLTETLLALLEEASSPREAAARVMEALRDKMVANSP
jgi:hypothetical protein